MPEDEPENISYTLKLCKEVLERYVSDYARKIYGTNKGIQVELSLDQHFEDREIPANDGTKALRWDQLEETIGCTIRMSINNEELDTGKLIEIPHSEFMDDLGLRVEDPVESAPEDEPKEIRFSASGTNMKNLARKIGITPRDMQTAIYEMHDSGSENYKAITLNNGSRQR